MYSMKSTYTSIVSNPFSFVPFIYFENTIAFQKTIEMTTILIYYKQ